MSIDQTVTMAMALSETIADCVLSARRNAEAIEATQELLEVLRVQAEMIPTGNVVVLHA
ncbi:hypothetical protein [Thalassovita sp.]|uniref:hypothetical protein n=1 Tax=Thalassovita sp. TaxID=1979401 RepID=UPI002B268A45|nr:hypothetical protein [Thalassovita sp.]